MKKEIIAAAIAAYITKNADLFTAGKEGNELMAEKQLRNAMAYFASHTTINIFYSTANLQVFYTASEALNHVRGSNDERIFHIERVDVAALLEPETAPVADKPDPYDTNVKTLKALCDERGLVIDKKKPVKSDYITALVEDDAKNGTSPTTKLADHEVTQEDLDNNPDLAANNIKVGDIIQVPA